MKFVDVPLIWYITPQLKTYQGNLPKEDVDAQEKQVIEVPSVLEEVIST